MCGPIAAGASTLPMTTKTAAGGDAAAAAAPAPAPAKGEAAGPTGAVAGATGGGPADMAGVLAALTQALDGLKALLANGPIGGGPNPGQVPPGKLPGSQEHIGPGSTIPATGKPEVRQINEDGALRTVYFGPDGKEMTAFQYTDSHQFKANLEFNSGNPSIALANLNRVGVARQERVRLLSNAIANDANRTGSMNPVDQQKLQEYSRATSRFNGVIQQLAPLASKLSTDEVVQLSRFTNDANGSAAVDASALEAILAAVKARP